MSVDDRDMARVHVDAIRRARVLHRCYECRNEIRPGDYYRVDSGIDHDRHPFTYKTCLACIRIRNWLIDEMAANRLPENNHVDAQGSWIWGELHEACAEALGDWADANGRCRHHYWQPDGHADCDY